jgi:N,N-dimethylformamidase
MKIDLFQICRLPISRSVSICLALFATPSVSLAQEPARTIVGYSSELSVRPGDTVDFMVNSVNGEPYQADLVRVINGESQSIYGDQFKVEYAPSSFEGTYEGKPQALNLGSYIQVGDTSALDQLESFTVSGWIYPVFDTVSYEPPDLENPDPFHPPTLTYAPEIVDNPQTVVSRFDATTQTGWALRLNPEMQLEIAVGDGSGTVQTVTI